MTGLEIYLVVMVFIANTLCFYALNQWDRATQICNELILKNRELRNRIKEKV